MKHNNPNHWKIKASKHSTCHSYRKVDTNLINIYIKWLLAGKPNPNIKGWKFN